MESTITALNHTSRYVVAAGVVAAALSVWGIWYGDVIDDEAAILQFPARWEEFFVGNSGDFWKSASHDAVMVCARIAAALGLFIASFACMFRGRFASVRVAGLVITATMGIASIPGFVLTMHATAETVIAIIALLFSGLLRQVDYRKRTAIVLLLPLSALAGLLISWPHTALLGSHFADGQSVVLVVFLGVPSLLLFWWIAAAAESAKDCVRLPVDAWILLAFAAGLVLARPSLAWTASFLIGFAGARGFGVLVEKHLVGELSERIGHRLKRTALLAALAMPALLAGAAVWRIETRYQLMERTQAVFILCCAAVMAAAVLGLAVRNVRAAAFCSFLLTAAAAKWFLVGVWTPEQDRLHSARPYANAIRAAVLEGESLFTDLPLSPAYRYYLHRRVEPALAAPAGGYVLVGRSEPAETVVRRYADSPFGPLLLTRRTDQVAAGRHAERQ